MVQEKQSLDRAM